MFDVPRSKVQSNTQIFFLLSFVRLYLPYVPVNAKVTRLSTLQLNTLWMVWVEKWTPNQRKTLQNAKRVYILGLCSLSGKTSHRQISWSIEAARSGVMKFVSLWNFTDISAAVLPKSPSNFRVIGKVKNRISRIRDFGGKTSYRLVNKCPGLYISAVCYFPFEGVSSLYRLNLVLIVPRLRVPGGLGVISKVWYFKLIIESSFSGTRCEIALSWMPKQTVMTNQHW